MSDKKFTIAEIAEEVYEPCPVPTSLPIPTILDCDCPFCEARKKTLYLGCDPSYIVGEPSNYNYASIKSLMDHHSIKAISESEESILQQKKLEAMKKHAEESIEYFEKNEARIREEKKKAAAEDKTCLSNWFPLLEIAGVPVPKTIIINTDADFYKVYEGGRCDKFDLLVDQVMQASLEIVEKTKCDSIFLRSGHTSAKHSWDDTCNLRDFKNRENVIRHILSIFEFSEIASITGIPSSVWAVREMLPVKKLAICKRYGNMPFVREYRFFMSGESIDSVQPYWPSDALSKGAPSDQDWLSKWEEAYCFYPDEDTVAMVKKAGKALGGRYSVDVLETDRGWYVTDCAEADKSWRWDKTKPIPWEQE